MWGWSWYTGEDGIEGVYGKWQMADGKSRDTGGGFGMGGNPGFESRDIPAV